MLSRSPTSPHLPSVRMGSQINYTARKITLLQVCRRRRRRHRGGAQTFWKTMNRSDNSCCNSVRKEPLGASLRPKKRWYGVRVKGMKQEPLGIMMNEQTESFKAVMGSSFSQAGSVSHPPNAPRWAEEAQQWTGGSRRCIMNGGQQHLNAANESAGYCSTYSNTERAFLSARPPPLRRQSHSSRCLL